MNYGWKFVKLYRRQGLSSSPRKRNIIKQNGCSEEDLQIVVKKEKQKTKEKRKDKHI